jgi:hypothetical protein
MIVELKIKINVYIVKNKEHLLINMNYNNKI